MSLPNDFSGYSVGESSAMASLTETVQSWQTRDWRLKQGLGILKTGTKAEIGCLMRDMAVDAEFRLLDAVAGEKIGLPKRSPGKQMQ